MPNLGRVVGIDYGTVRIGIAISDPDRVLSSPYETYNRKNLSVDTAYFQRLAQENNVTQFVVGLPLHLSGQESEKSQEAVQFAHWLHELTGVPVDFVDERFSSVEAERYLRSANLSAKKLKARRDKLAAQIILSTYLESGPMRRDQATSLD